MNFEGTISGNVYAQPLYIEGGPGGRAMVIAVTESNNVYALDAASGKVIWQDHVGVPVPTADLLCGDINPLGITGTPIVDLASRTMFLDAMTTPDGGTTKQHLIYALNVDTGTTNAGWPVNVNSTATSGDEHFQFVPSERTGLPGHRQQHCLCAVRRACGRLRAVSRLAGRCTGDQSVQRDGMGDHQHRRGRVGRRRPGQRRDESVHRHG